MGKTVVYPVKMNPFDWYAQKIEQKKIPTWAFYLWLVVISSALVTINNSLYASCFDSQCIVAAIPISLLILGILIIMDFLAGYCFTFWKTIIGKGLFGLTFILSAFSLFAFNNDFTLLISSGIGLGALIAGYLYGKKKIKT